MSISLFIELQQLRSKVEDLDIPHPTIPEYIELHEKMQTIIKEIDDMLARDLERHR